MNALGAIVTLTLCLMVLGLSRRGAAVAIILGVCYITQGQVINVGFNFTAIRLVMLAGLIRVMSRGELKAVEFNKIDKALTYYIGAVVVIAAIRSGTIEGLIYQSGILYNAFLSYFVFRALIRDQRELREMLSLTSVVLVPYAVCLIGESIRHYNVFAVFGGVSYYSMVREGDVRSQGVFRSPITNGALGATLASMYIGLLLARFPGARPRSLLGIIVGIIVVICAHSSGPLLGLGFGVIAFAVWPFRRHVRKIRWGILLSIVGLHLIMKAPVWFLIGRVSDIVGGGGYHRAYLIDKFVKSFGSWWLIGMDPIETGHWFPYTLRNGAADITNQFVSDGLNGGLLGVTMQIIVIALCFQRLGAFVKEVQATVPGAAKFAWGIGSTLVATIGIYFSVTYFDQMHVIWYFLLASVSAVCTLDPQETGAESEIENNPALDNEIDPSDQPNPVTI